MQNDFINWITSCNKRDGKPYTKRTALHYESGLRVTSDYMMKTGVINKPLENMSLTEFTIAMGVIFANPYFVAKNKTGNNMYSNALKRYRCFLDLSTDLEKKAEQEEKLIEIDSSLTATERETLIMARVGQGNYRNKIFKRYSGKCLITGLTINYVLVASHIKPWANCNNGERLDEFNGLLLSATYDRLFDVGLITFNEKGEIKLSSMISSYNSSILGLHNKQVFDIKFATQMKKYLDYHHKVIFVP